MLCCASCSVVVCAALRVSVMFCVFLCMATHFALCMWHSACSTALRCVAHPFLRSMRSMVLCVFECIALRCTALFVLAVALGVMLWSHSLRVCSTFQTIAWSKAAAVRM